MRYRQPADDQDSGIFYLLIGGNSPQNSINMKERLHIKIDGEQCILVPQSGDKITESTTRFYQLTDLNGELVPTRSHTFKTPLLEVMKFAKAVTTSGHRYSWDSIHYPSSEFAY